MTTAELILELRRSLGNRNDIDDERYLSWINWALYDVAGFHGKRAVRAVRFKELENIFFTTLEPHTFEITEILGTGYGISVTGIPADMYVLGQVVVIDGNQNSIIGVNDTNTELQLLNRLEEVEESGAVIHPYMIDVRDTIENSWVVDGVVNMNTGEKMRGVDWVDIALDPMVGIGVPEKFGRRGSFLYFDKAVLERNTFRLYTYTTPPLLTIGEPSVEPVLPRPLHETIVLGAMWRAHDKIMEPDRANAAREKYIQELSMRLTDNFLEDEFTERQFRVRRK